MKRKSFLSNLGKGAIMLALLPENILAVEQRNSFFLLVTGGGTFTNDLEEKVLSPLLGQCTNVRAQIQNLVYVGKELSHENAFFELTGFSLQNPNENDQLKCSLFFTGHLNGGLKNKKVFLNDNDCFQAALAFKKERPSQSVICYLNEADAAHYSIDEYQSSLNNYAKYAALLLEEANYNDEMTSCDFIVSGEMGRDAMPDSHESGWHHVCEESRKTKCLWISRNSSLPILHYTHQIKGLIQNNFL